MTLVSAESSFIDLFFDDILVADGQVRAPSRLLVRQLCDAGVSLSSVHRYMINWRPSFVMKAVPKEFGVGHAFDKPIWNFSIMHGPTPNEEKTMRTWIKDLVCRRATLNPPNSFHD